MTDSRLSGQAVGRLSFGIPGQKQSGFSPALPLMGKSGKDTC
ncbi:hypothetical protein HMPREF9141_2178 [Prevotella multiformis DSM 16608]|uniref:Uncharacterized protein n=1 Tax=Prevotella multiformis DSM 16608 TaxID=888743 RepID=F0F9B1_9BACT|nr:hypothetical protein HMPREF9141_2178 [Prevotella multiformis DSM 16608]